ncbi:MAG: hypothetical protein ACHQYP_12110 [Nitrospiria bacterium]
MVQNDQPIVTTCKIYDDYPFEAVDKEILAAFERLRSKKSDIKGRDSRHISLLRLLECFLQITGQRLIMSMVYQPSFEKICREFTGALYSNKFNDWSPEWRYSIALRLFHILRLLNHEQPSPFIPRFNAGIQFHTDVITEEVEECIFEFENLALLEEKVWLWRGWQAINRNGRKINFPFYSIYRRLGREFTQSFHTVCADYLSARKAGSLPFLNSLIRFINQYPESITVLHFKRSEFVSQFWRGFFGYYMKTGYKNGNGARISTLIGIWRGSFLNFLNDYLIPSGLICETWSALPFPESRSVPARRTHVKTTTEGDEVRTKLLTHVPLHLTDNEAMYFLFEQIQRDVDLFVNWAEWAVNDIWKRYQRRLDLAVKGKVRRIEEKSEKTFLTENGRWFKEITGGTKPRLSWLTNRANPEYLQNAAATFDDYGFITHRDVRAFHLIFPTPISQTAEELAMPTTDALLPHCVLLIANHPAITPSFLEKLELFDKNGKQIGLQLSDSGYQLVGHKDRRGHLHAQQIIPLTTQTAELVKQVIALTQPLRDYLKARHDDNWRYLFLTSGCAFSYPGRINLHYHAPRISNVFAESLRNTCNLVWEDICEKAKAFSLSALRASVAVLVYLQTHSVDKMAKALGHAKYDHNLLARYLPDPILGFFQERWIRIFQAGIIVEALKESDYLLQATEFNSMNELDAFLSKHALKLIPKGLEDLEGSDDHPAFERARKEVVFGVNTAILTILISLQTAVSEASRQVNAKACYWAGISQRLIAYLESELASRNDLQSYLAAARRNANPDLMKGLIYGK